MREGDDFVVVPSEEIAEQIEKAKIPSLSGKAIIVAEKGLDILTIRELKQRPEIRGIIAHAVLQTRMLIQEQLDKLIERKLPKDSRESRAVNLFRLNLTFHDKLAVDKEGNVFWEDDTVVA